MKNSTTYVAGLLAASLCQLSYAEQTVTPKNAIELDSIEVSGVRARLQKAGTLVDVIQKTELITDEAIAKKNASMLTEAIAGENGIRVSNECAMCGVKRVMINGMKGEHTTVLIDGVPLFSGVAGFYGMDAITSAGIGRIEIARGAGASLIAPEAIGGTINLITKRATKDSLNIDAGIGEEGYERLSATGTAVSADGATRLVAAGQIDNRNQFDGDNNGVSENPSLENSSVFATLSHDINDSNTIDLRAAFFRSDVFGGPTSVGKNGAISSYSDPSDSLPLALFQNGDVRQQYTGKPWETAEVVDTERQEFMGRWTSELNADTSMVLTAAYAEHVQDSFYEGFDYFADDDLYYVDGKFTHVLNDNHTLTFGADYRDEKMRSRSAKVLADPNLTSDSYDHSDFGLYIQDVWTPTLDLEISMALRADHIKVDFIEQPNGDVIDKTLLAPRAHIRYIHNDNWTSRFSAGKGYRAPLSIFETEHGILEDGFNIAITDIEESLSANYSLSYESPRLTATGSLGWTEVENAAATDDSSGILTLINTDKNISAIVTDFALGYQVSPRLAVNAGLEFYAYDDNYKETFAIAPIETRARIGLDYSSGPWTANSTLTWVDSRNLAEYGYANRYNTFNDANNNGTVEAGELQDPKSTHAPSYFTLDARLEYKLNNTVSLYLGGNNLLDYNQADDEESPLLWDADGGYDVVHIYAPLRGRVVYGGIKATF